MKHFILKTEPDKDKLVRLSGDDYHYLVRVKRLAQGEFFPALLPNGEKTLVQVQLIDNDILIGKCSKKAENAGNITSAKKLPPIFLFQALPKGEKMDIIVRQAGETGLTEIVPFVSQFSIAKINAAGGSQQKISRWQRIIKEARQQSGSVIETGVCPPLTMDGLFVYWEELKIKMPGTLGLIFHHLPIEKSSLHGYLENVPEAVVMAIGPEGGFSGPEVSRFLEAGFMPLTIGDTILRTETAALYCAASIRTILLEKDSWKPK